MEQQFKRLRALYPGRYGRSQLKERIFQGMHPHLRDSMWFLYMKDGVSYEEFLAAVYEAENEGTESNGVKYESKSYDSRKGHRRKGKE